MSPAQDGGAMSEDECMEILYHDTNKSNSKQYSDATYS